MYTTKPNGTESSQSRNCALSSRLRRVPHIHVCLKVLRPRRTTPAPRCPREVHVQLVSSAAGLHVRGRRRGRRQRHISKVCLRDDCA